VLPFKCDCCVAGLLGVQALAVGVAAFYWHFLAEGICHGPGDPRLQMAQVL